MNFPGKMIQLETIIQTEVTQTQKDKQACTQLQVNINHKVQDIHNTLHRPQKLKKKDDPNEHGSISLRRSKKTVPAGRWK